MEFYQKFKNLVRKTLPNPIRQLCFMYIGGGYHSPIPSQKEIRKYNFNAPLPKTLPGIDLNDQEQLSLLESFESFYREQPFSDEKTAGLRYYFINGWFGCSDALLLYCMIRHLNPKKIIEVGSGFSSAVMLDTNERFMGNSVHCTFIEPYPTRLKSLLNPNDEGRVTIHQKRLQDIPLEVFMDLKENDILFIDSSHVAKLNSDVTYYLHELLPALASGVYIHIHDILYPFEWPQRFYLDGSSPNEQYMLRAFLEYNQNFKIVMFNSYLASMKEEEIKKRFPLLLRTPGSIWLKRI